MKKVYIVGIGMEGRQSLTQQAQEAIDSADCLIGAERMLKPFSDISKNKLTSWDSSEISDYVMSTRFSTLMPCLCPATVDTSAVQRIS